MRYQGREQSRNIEDRRGQRGGGGMRKIGGGIGIGTVLLLVLTLLMGGDASDILGTLVQSGGGAGQSIPTPTNNNQPYQGNAQEEALAELVGVTLKETEDVWHGIFRNQLQRNYQEATLVLFTDATQSACGVGRSATGPFYCPADQKIYIDLSFYNQLSQRFGAGGDFAMAYVVAHEVAHHVQNLLGITRQIDAQRGRISQEAQNDLSVRLELQADFLSGVWAHHAHKANNILERGDIEEAMRAAEAIGDDNIQKQSQGYIVPENFTHGTSEQRMRWLRKGLKTGDIGQGDTFSAQYL
jgi:predicted metalloprotease